jgi:hypothetical protein
MVEIPQATVGVPVGRMKRGKPDLRPRCSHTGKVAFPTLERAERSAKQARINEELHPHLRRPGKIMKAYFCIWCQHYHVGHGRPE